MAVGKPELLEAEELDELELLDDELDPTPGSSSAPPQAAKVVATMEASPTDLT